MAPNPKRNATEFGLWCDECARPLHTSITIRLPKGAASAEVRHFAKQALLNIACAEGWDVTEGKGKHRCADCQPPRGRR